MSDPTAQGPASATPTAEPRETAETNDLVAGATLAIAAAVGASILPEGSVFRFVLVAPVLFLVPGYLLIQAVVVPPAPARRRLMHALVSVGASPAIVGLLALGTAIFDGGFRQSSIVAAVTIACVVSAFVAYHRRSGALLAPASAPREV